MDWCMNGQLYNDIYHEVNFLKLRFRVLKVRHAPPTINKEVVVTILLITELIDHLVSIVLILFNLN